MPLEKKVKTVKKYIRIFNKRIKHILIKSMFIAGKIKIIRKKLATAGTKHPFIKDYKFSVSR